ncbi:MAG: low molecular weight phosphotyrosine protein phosphatase, partial [Gammaproteobacteria bacterium]|nr:low molecular weight phosphotyrosine protein phosphatase [Gammaproteobacteria bacterium]
MKVLFVDAGNYCRSPAAEIVARSIAARAGVSGWQFGSAGLKDKHVGDTADPRSITACAERGYDLSAFRCRQISDADFQI